MTPRALLLTLLLPVTSIVGFAQESADDVVYGSTPGGFCAAIAAAREGASVILLEPTGHIGGLSTGGLSHCDSNQMRRETLMGLFDEWHTRIVKDYTDRGLLALDGIAKGFSARGPQQPNYAFDPPKIAADESFKSVVADKTGQVHYQLHRRVLEFVAGHETELARHLAGIEQRKVGGYAGSIDDIRERNRKIDLTTDTVRRHAPKLDSKCLAEKMTTLDRQMGHARPQDARQFLHDDSQCARQPDQTLRRSRPHAEAGADRPDQTVSSLGCA